MIEYILIYATFARMQKYEINYAPTCTSAPVYFYCYAFLGKSFTLVPFHIFMTTSLYETSIYSYTYF